MSLALALLVTAAPPQLLPVDEAKRDPSLVAFRAKLLRAIEAKDAKFLLARVSPDIRTSFGGGGGRKDFQRQWKLPSAKSPVWETLDRVFRHGGGFQGKGFWAPYVYAKWPDRYGPFEHAAVLGKRVPWGRTPRGGASGYVDYAIVRLLPEKPESSHRKVQILGGPAVYIRQDALYSPVGYRACLERRKGQWAITALVAGD
ncbi:MAG: hypothetical protein ACO1SV_08770 [Fimbriimonas sp.]